MRKQVAVLIALQFTGVLVSGAWVERPVDGIKNETNDVTMAITESRVTDRALEVGYEIINGSERDIWICGSIISWPWAGQDYEIYLPEGSGTLVVRRRNIPTSREWSVPPCATYIRLRAGEQQSESLFLPLPVRPAPVLFWSPHIEKTIYATYVLIEIGFYGADFPGEVFDSFSEQAAGVTRSNERVRDRDDTILVSYPRLYPEQERVLSAVTQVPYIPYAEESIPSLADQSRPPDLSTCTRIEIKYHPSMLDYFFPSIGEQNLLSKAEREQMQAYNTTVVDHQEQIMTFARDIERGERSLIVTRPDHAEVVCYGEGRTLACLAIVGDRRLLTDDGEQFKYVSPLDSLRALAPQVEPYELRVQCARNLKNLWYRFRLLPTGGKAADPADSAAGAAIRYATAARWTDDLIEAYHSTGIEDETGTPYKCPSAGEGKCHYAMNPNCEPNSPGDTVLLFETKAGWNQHGGPELFTFDNHDPKGGCVLLNDGTVKFIRIQEELEQLRWKP